MRLVIKVGTKAIFDFSKKKIKREILQSLAKDVAYLLKEKHEIIIVSSGAVGCGKEVIDKEGGIGLKQAQAAVGQIKLIEEYNKVFSKYGVHVAQFLLSSEDLKNVKRLKNIKRTYDHLSQQIISIINENDVTTTEELSFGDNDLLAVEVLLNLDFDILLVLTDKGALIKNGKKVLRTMNFSVGMYDDFSKDAKGFGGLKSKLDSAKKAIENNKKFIIGKAGDSIPKILEKKIPATYFYK